MQEAETVAAPVEERDGPDEGQSRRTGWEILWLPRPFQQELKVRWKDCNHLDIKSSGNDLFFVGLGCYELVTQRVDD